MADDDTFDQLEDLVEPEALAAWWPESAPEPVERVDAASAIGWEDPVQPQGNTDGDDQFLFGHLVQQEAALSEPVPMPLEREMDFLSIRTRVVLSWLLARGTVPRDAQQFGLLF